jgi:tRNA (guanine-N7-)-methyltransferase
VTTSRVYIRRQGRMTKAQANALREQFDRYRLDPQVPFDAATIFGRVAPLALEVGFGMGQGLLEYARGNPHVNCIGAEVYRPGIGALTAALVREEIDNIRIFEGDVRALIAHLPTASLTEIMVYFPDPWPKTRHHKRRLIEPKFAAGLAHALTPAGRLALATDWEDYAHWMLAVLDAEPGLINAAGRGNFSVRPAGRPFTRFEARGVKLGHRVWDLVYTKAATTESR